jgi:hypothetical protein
MENSHICICLYHITGWHLNAHTTYYIHANINII